MKRNIMLGIRIIWMFLWEIFMDKKTLGQEYKRDRKKVIMFFMLFAMIVLTLFLTRRLYVVTKEHHHYLKENHVLVEKNKVNSLSKTDIKNYSADVINKAVEASVDKNIGKITKIENESGTNDKKDYNRQDMLIKELDKMEN